MELMIVGLLATGAFAFVAYPLVTRKRYLYYLEDMLGMGEQKKLAYLYSRRSTVYENLRDLDGEFQMGKLTQTDHERLRAGLMAEAAAIIQEIDQAHVRREVEDMIEGDARARRKDYPMKHTSIRGHCVAFAFSVLAITLFAADAGAFAVHGTVTNGTTGVTNVSAKVTVVSPSQGMEEEGTFQATNGHFEVPNLDGSAPIYLLEVEYDGVTYETPLRVTGEDQTASVTIYERTSSWDGIHVIVPHLAVSRGGDFLSVEELYEISNETSPPKTAAGDDGLFQFYLPADMDTLAACRVTSLGVPVDRTPEKTRTPNMYRIDYPIRPGKTEISVSYLVPYASGKYALSEHLAHDVDHLMVYAVDPQIKVTSPSHTLEQQPPVHGMLAFAVHGLKGGTDLVLNMEGGDPNFAGTGATAGGNGGGSGSGDATSDASGNVIVVPSDSERLSVLFMIALLLVFGGVIAVALRDEIHPLSDARILRNHYDKIVGRMARLDDLNAANAVPRDAYRAARDELLGQAAALALKLRTHGGIHEPPTRHEGHVANESARTTKA